MNDFYFLRCNQEVEAKVVLRKSSWNRGTEGKVLQLNGINGAAMDYAVHGHATVHISTNESNYQAQCCIKRREGDSLLVELPRKHFISHPQRLYVHFEINHWYFSGLHKAVDSISKATVCKLLPAESGRGIPPTHRYKRALEPFTLDPDYQMPALHQMISSNPELPFLVLGPFGTGKTHVLAAAVSALFCDPHNHILVCAHQHLCADSIYRSLQTHYQSVSMHAIRLVPSDNVANNVIIYNGGLVKTTNTITIEDLNENAVVVTTFLTALNLKRLDPNGTSLYFSHIIIDEGAQSREPEALGALGIAAEDTKIVIVGDNKQVC